MKNHFLLFTIIAAFAGIFLSSCGASDSVYCEDWFETNGYVIEGTVLNPRTGQTDNNSEFVAGVIPDGETVAVRYEHTYNPERSLSCTFKVYKLTTDEDREIVDELIEDPNLTKRFTIPRSGNFEKIEGFIFYCDPASNMVYVVNNLYKDKYVDHSNYRKNPEYRFEISINGIRRLTIDMNYQTTTNNRPY